MASTNTTRAKVGDILELSIEKVAHGGHFIARYGGQVIFVRHAIPGERCRIIITSTGSSFNRADVIEVLDPSPDRVIAPCSFSHQAGCGGCDFQHISLTRQRQLKSDVIAEQFLRIAKMNVQVDVEEVGGPLHWRTRSIATTTKDGKLGFYGSRSHTVVPIQDCIIAIENMEMPELAARTWRGDVRIEIATSNTGERNIALAPKRGEGRARLTEGNQTLHEVVAGKTLKVSQDSFWQAHVKAPEVLTEALLSLAQLQSGDHVLDLYGGVGLFAAAMIDIVGGNGSIDLIESSKSATSDAAKNFANNSNVRITTGDVAKLLPRIAKADVVVLDPPRIGAGKIVLTEIARMAPRAVVYIACDPAALARDTAYFLELGYSIAKTRAFDLFPMTHHIECIALYLPTKV